MHAQGCKLVGSRAWMHAQGCQFVARFANTCTCGMVWERCCTATYSTMYSKVKQATTYEKEGSKKC